MTVILDDVLLDELWESNVVINTKLKNHTGDKGSVPAKTIQLMWNGKLLSFEKTAKGWVKQPLLTSSVK